MKTLKNASSISTLQRLYLERGGIDLNHLNRYLDGFTVSVTGSQLS
jgi:hypothetical protein